VFLLDIRNGRLLQSNASSKVPANVVNEAGIDDDDDQNFRTPSSNCKDDLLSKRHDADDQLNAVSASAKEMINMATDMISKATNEQVIIKHHHHLHHKHI
jgi:hypothetical protein